MRYYFFFFKQETAYDMRISDWSSDVCSSDLSVAAARDFLCQDEIDSVARKDKPGNRTLRGYRHSDGAHARAKRRCQETAISGLDQRTLGDGLPGRDGVANDSAGQ